MYKISALYQIINSKVISGQRVNPKAGIYFDSQNTGNISRT